MFENFRRDPSHLILANQSCQMNKSFFKLYESHEKFSKTAHITQNVKNMCSQNLINNEIDSLELNGYSIG